MPIFEFVCERCGHSFESICKPNVEVLSCSCGGEGHKVMSSPAPPIIHGEDGSHHRWVKKNRFDWKPKESLMAPRVYDMEFGATERRRLADKAAIVGE